MFKSFGNLIGEMVTFFLVAVLGATFVLGVILPAEQMDDLIIGWKADVASKYFSDSPSK